MCDRVTAIYDRLNCWNSRLAGAVIRIRNSLLSAINAARRFADTLIRKKEII
jgi:hypothetical protein